MQHFDLRAHFKGMVDEFRVILRGKHMAALLGQSGLDVPCVRQVQRDFAGFVAAFGVGQKQARAVEKTAFVIQQAGTAGEIVGVNDIVDFPFAGRIGQPPGVFVDALHGGRLAVAGSLHLHNVAGEIAHHIAARRPIGHLQQVQAAFFFAAVGQRNVPLMAFRHGGNPTLITYPHKKYGYIGKSIDVLSLFGFVEKANML